MLAELFIVKFYKSAVRNDSKITSLLNIQCESKIPPPLRLSHFFTNS